MLEELKIELKELEEQLEKETEKAAKEYKCPITLEIMRNPVVVIPGGQTFEGSYLEQWGDRCIQEGRDVINPLTREPIQNTVVNIAIKGLIDEMYGDLFQRIDCLRKRIRILEAEESAAAAKVAREAVEVAEAKEKDGEAVEACYCEPVRLIVEEERRGNRQAFRELPLMGRLPNSEIIKITVVDVKEYNEYYRTENKGLDRVLVYQYCTNCYDFNSVPSDLSDHIGVGSKNISVCGEDKYLQIWVDRRFQRFTTITNLAFRDTKAILIIFSVINRNSLYGLDTLIQYLLQRSNSQEIPIILVAVDKDREPRVISREEARMKASELNMTYLECSIDTGENVPEVFEIAVRLIMGQQAREAKREREEEERAAEEGAGARRGVNQKCVIQ